MTIFALKINYPMEHYLVSARKYRPATFRTVVGQQALTTTLKNAIANNHLAHAYLFCGPRGVGKTTCARIFAKTINCQNPKPDGEACDECESCRGFNEQRSFNIHELDAASNNSVDDIRSLVDQVRIPPQIGKYSVYIIDEVHMLSAAAFNAFLKTLEEPPAHAIFVLATTEKHKIIPTILSRCQIYDFNRIRVADIVEHLQYVANSEGVVVESEALNVIAQKADGAMRDALSIFDQVVSFCSGEITYKGVVENLNVLDYDYYFRLVEDFLAGRVNHAFMIFNEILNKGFDAQHFITGLASHVRDLLVSRDSETLVLLEVGASIAEQYGEQAQRCPISFLYRALEIANECDLNYKASRNKRLLVELTLVRLCQLTGVVPKPEDERIEIKPLVAIPVLEKPKEYATSSSVQPSVAPLSVAVSEPQQVYKSKPVDQPRNESVSVSQAAHGRAPQNLSISKVEPPKIMSDTVEEKTEQVSRERRSPFTSEQFMTAWKQCAKEIVEQAHTTNTMLNFLPEKVSDDSYKVLVVNNLQKKTLSEHQHTITAKLADILQNDFVTFYIEVDNTIAERSAFTPEEKLVKMQEKNSDFRDLTQQLGLVL